MRFGSVCSGIEAASVAWHPLGWRAQFLSEIEPFQSAVLAHHYPAVPNRGDMTKFKEWPDAAIDVLVGGTPCQSFSIAGLRKGLADPRGNLMLTYLAIAERYAPRWLVWENVPGVLSSNGGRDFGTLLGGLAELGYGFAYRVLDAQYFGLAQRRRRVFVVGYLGDWRRAAAVLFERESLLGHPAPRRETGKRIAATLTRGAESSGKGGYAGRRQEDDVNIVPVCPTLRAGGNRTGGDRPPGTDVDTADSLIVAHALRGEGFDASEDGTGRGTPLVPVPFDTTQITSAANRSNPRAGDPCHPLAAGGHAPAIAYAIQAGATRENPESGPDGIGVQTDIAYTLEARAEVQAIGFGAQMSTPQVDFELMQTLQAKNPAAVAVNIRGRDGGATAELSGDVATALRASQGGGDKLHALTDAAVRRLTPRECERLQGFPDDYTRIIVRGKPAADGPRYKALGNSMAVPVMHWIGGRIQMIENLTNKDAA